MFAIVAIGGKQYKVAPGHKIVVDSMPGKLGAKVTLPNILLLFDGTKTALGTPFIKNVVVTAKVLAQGKGEKINVRRFKSKVRYRKSIGFRPLQTTLEITSIGKA